SNLVLVGTGFFLGGFRTELRHLFGSCYECVLGGQDTIDGDLERLLQLLIVKPCQVGKFALRTNDELVFVFGDDRACAEGDGVDLACSQEQASIGISKGSISANIGADDDHGWEQSEHDVQAVEVSHRN